MPQASYKSYIGIAKDSINTTLSAAVAASATTVPVVGTSVPASSTITIVDGPLTEQRAVTAGGGTSSLTVSALTNAHSANTYVSAQLTASLGPADYIPVTSIEVEDQIVQLKDRGLRSSAVEEYANQQGTRLAMVKLGGDVFPDTFPYFVGGVTGAADFSGGTPNTHTFSVKNTTDTQPTPFLLWDFNGTDQRMYAGAKVEQLDVNFDPSGLLTWQASLQSWMSGPVPSTTPSYSSVSVAPTWQVQATIGGTNVLYVMTANLSIKRPVESIYTLQNIQDPYKLWSRPQTIEGSMNVVMEDNTQLNNFLNNSQPSLTLLFTPSGANPNTIQFTMTKCNFETGKPKQTGGRGFVELAINFRGLANTTDATTAGTGFSPVKVTCKNAKATGTFQ